MEIGAQLFTLRDFCKTLDDFALTLQKVAEIGYRTVQVSAVCPYEPQWLKEQLRKNGLRCVLTHTAGDVIAADPVKVAHDHDVYDCDHIGLGWYKFQKETLEQDLADFVEKYTPVASTLRTCGKTFMYHNHDQEFQHIGKKCILDLLSEKVPDMGFTFDTYWAQVGGADPALYLEKLAGRIPCIHLKDCGYGRRMDVIGEGNINFDRVFEKAEAGGTKYMLVEQDDCNGEDPFDCLRRSYEYLTACGFH